MANKKLILTFSASGTEITAELEGVPPVATAEKEADKYLKGIELQGAINMYDRKLEERERISAGIRSEYSSLDDKFISGNFSDVTNAFNDIKTGELGTMRSSIQELNKDISALNALSTISATCAL